MTFWEKNQKKILAVFTAGLMVAFAYMPSGKGGGSGSSDPLFATVGGKNVRYSEVQRAARELTWLRQHGELHDQYGQTRSIMTLLPPSLESELEQHQDMYYLLLKDSQRMGVHVPNDTVQTLLVNNVVIPPDLTTDDEVVLRNGVTHLLEIRENMRRAMSTIKISQPMREHALAEHAQTMSVKAVEFPAAEFRSQVPAPTDLQLNEQFTSYGNKDKDNPEPTNKFDFGYRYPTRVRVQYIELKHDDVKKAIQATHSTYDWEVLAEKYYRLNETEFANPATTKPSVKPFAQVKQEILDHLQGQEITSRSQQIITAINQALQSDYANWVKAPNSASSVGPAYNTYEYLPALAGEVQKKFGVLPTINSQAEGKSPKELAQLPGIGQADLQNGTSFTTYITTRVEPLAISDKEHAIKLFQPTPLMIDRDQNQYIARAVEATPARMAADRKEVAMQMDADIKTQEAYDMAKASAQKFIADASKATFDSVAATAGRKVTTTGQFGMDTPTVPHLDLDDLAMPTFITQSMRLINSDPKTGPHPMTIIELPRQQKLFVVQLDSLSPHWSADHEYALMGEVDFDISRGLSMQFLSEWFSYAELANRLEYHPMART